jgi:enoyl-CoA hydratase/carnithine racemase
MSHLISSIDHRVATLTLTNPPQNRITAEMTDDLAHALTEIGRSDARAVVLCAEGPDFSLGGDITDWPDAELRELRTLFERHMAVFNQFEQLPFPVIAAVQGQCLGGGFELALRADVILAGESACFGHPEQTLGLVTLLGGIYRVAERAGRSRAFEWALTSERVPALVMATAGVVNRVVADDALLDEAGALAETLAHGATRAHAAHKALLRAWALGGTATADEAMFDIAMPLFQTDDVKAGLASAVHALEAGRPRPVLEFRGR